MHDNQYVNRELSWLQFNARVLQEAADIKVPLIERLRFIGIFYTVGRTTVFSFIETFYFFAIFSNFAYL